MSPSFSVYVEFSTPDASPDTYEALFEALADVDGSVGPAPSGCASARFTVQAPDFTTAASTSLATIAAVTGTRGVPLDSVMRLHIDSPNDQGAPIASS
ncbi:hypothetical protein [Streptomyces qinglanensis]|uniref:hypothetical protein n=1 Tax=Streptomyces qinglanensis TaxID=943816 RepID=UPI003D753148